MTTERLEVQRTIAADPATIFAVLCEQGIAAWAGRRRKEKMRRRRQRFDERQGWAFPGEGNGLEAEFADSVQPLLAARRPRDLPPLRRQALRQLKGLLGDKARDWRARIIEASALIEAGIDFSDEGDVPAELIAPALAKVKALLTEIEEVVAGQGRAAGERRGYATAPCLSWFARPP